MRFAPKSEEEIDTRTLLPNGEYDATVLEASDEKSKSSNNDQIHLLLLVKSDDGQQNRVHDYLLEAMAGKLRHFCAATDLMSEYEAGQLTAADCAGQDMRVKLAVEKGKGEYADKNVVRDYLARNGHAPKPLTPAKQPSQTSGSAEGNAKKAFLVSWNRFVGEFPAEAGRRDEYWSKCFTEFFPGKDRTQLGDTDWDKFRIMVAKWDPINGWPKPQPASPVSSQQQFNDDDIPF